MARLVPEQSGVIPARLTKKMGPRTARGKAASSQNARKHGLRSTDVVIPGEIPKEFDDLLQDVRRDLKPVGAVEEELVEHIASSMWRLRRARRIETSIYAFRESQLYPRGEGSQQDHVTEDKYWALNTAGRQSTSNAFCATRLRSNGRCFGP